MCELIAANRSKGCNGTQGGNAVFYPFNFIENAFTVVDGVATAINPLLTEVFKYELKGDSQIFTAPLVTDENTGTSLCTQNLALQLHAINASSSFELTKMAQGKVTGVLKDFNDNYHVVAANGFKTFTADPTTGGARTDFNGYNITGVAETKDLPALLDETTKDAFLLLVST